MSAHDVQLERSSGSLRRRLLVMLAAVALGLALQAVLGRHLESLQALAQEDVVAARAKLAGVLQIVAIALFGPIAALGAFLAAACVRSLGEQRFPPAGSWGFATTRTWTGPSARRVALVMLALAVALALAAVAGGLVTWTMALRLLACRAT